MRTLRARKRVHPATRLKYWLCILKPGTHIEFDAVAMNLTYTQFRNTIYQLNLHGPEHYTIRKMSDVPLKIGVMRDA